MISTDLLLSDDCPQPEIDFKGTGKAVIWKRMFQTGILQDKLPDGLLSLRRYPGRSAQNEPLYYVIFASPIPGYSWVSEESDYETAFSTYSSLVYEEFI
ncbi:hypothetical protein [Methanosarcina horonobensis]|uniref:hypothetical protein n=1 Tax=Methanosarcina horonobensis TaxID=418008 RepID=UPI00064EBE9A|nr:hypothetical protein [Methanosarcina horonobensis]